MLAELDEYRPVLLQGDQCAFRAALVAGFEQRLEVCWMVILVLQRSPVATELDVLASCRRSLQWTHSLMQTANVLTMRPVRCTAVAACFALSLSATAPASTVPPVAARSTLLLLLDRGGFCLLAFVA
jgi:hypothetical protein